MTAMDERIGRILQRVEDHEVDIRQFAPLVNEFSDWRAETRTEIRTLKGDLKEMREQQKEDARQCQAGIQAVQKRLDDEAKERRGNRWILVGACIGLFGTFASSTVTVLVAVL